MACNHVLAGEPQPPHIRVVELPIHHIYRIQMNLNMLFLYQNSKHPKTVMNRGLPVARSPRPAWAFVPPIIAFACAACVPDAIVLAPNVVCVGRPENEGVSITDCFIRTGVYDIVLDGIRCVCDHLPHADIRVMPLLADAIEILCERVRLFDSKSTRDPASNGGGRCP